MSQNGKSRDALLREANEVRSKLLRTVEQLDQRRHDAFDVKLQLQRHVRQLALVGGVVVIATAAAVTLVVQRVSSAASRRRRNRWRLARQLWWKPDRALRAERRSFLGEVGRSLLLALVSTAVTLPARRVVAQLLEPKEPSPAKGR